MDKKNFWLVCKHILAGDINEMQLRIDEVALCRLCTEKLLVKNLKAVHESQLMELIKDMGMVADVENLGKKKSKAKAHKCLFKATALTRR